MEPASHESSEIGFGNSMDQETFGNEKGDKDDQNRKRGSGKPLTQEMVSIVEQREQNTTKTKRSQPQDINLFMGTSQHKEQPSMKSSFNRTKNAIFIVKRLEDGEDGQATEEDDKENVFENKSNTDNEGEIFC